ncbi:hypothetical protein BJ508DRAFT_357927 [Ascobolus immersus RN42]|uniref:DASH complex subunit DAD3 n=1 Tax=Ascobolus immersus RN42 TaxID=1160509 RepID=A0A3N4IQ39_ASCIM|nr:hypothetical protein BJ508DRAFT_357927 [Ascobolus immersus RN42]
MSSPPATAFHGASNTPLLTPLEEDILEAYRRLLDNMNRLADHINSLAEKPPQIMLDQLRELERKSGLVFTAFKASVYSLMLQEQLTLDEEPGEVNPDETSNY